MDQNWTINDTPMSLRPATEEDLNAVLKIEAQSYPTPWTREQFKEEMQKPFANFLVLTDDETDSTVAGYVIYWIMFDEAHILNVTSALDWRGLGIGTRLVRHVISHALKKEVKKVFLEVRKSNSAAVALYQKVGFFIYHVKKSFYSDGEDAYFMQLFLEKQNDF